MPRSRRTATSLFSDFSRHLRELGSSKHWDETTFLLFFNEEKDLLEMQLQDRHEGYATETWSTDLAADQSHYSIPAHAGRVKRVLRYFSGPGRLVPLQRNEHISSASSTESGSTTIVGSYRMLDDYIVLDPIPGEAVTDGLKIEIEVASDRLTTSDTLPNSFPIYAETLLVLRSVARAWGQEESEDTTRPLPTFFARRLAEAERLFESYTTTRTFGRHPGARFAQGG